MVEYVGVVGGIAGYDSQAAWDMQEAAPYLGGGLLVAFLLLGWMLRSGRPT